MYKVGELIKWRSVRDEDYSYGYIKSMGRNVATVIGTGYYDGVEMLVSIRRMRKLKKGEGVSNGGSKGKNSKR